MNMENKKLDFDFCDLHLTRSGIETVLGYKDGEDREIVSDLIEEILKEAERITDIKTQYSLFNDIQFHPGTKSVDLNKISFGIEKIVYGQLRKSEILAVFLCTAGPEIGNLSKKAMQEKDFLRGYIYDITGSEIVEAAADLMQADLEKNMLRHGYRITNRYSPGYCGWDVAEQHKLFQLIPDNYCRIQLTDSALMDPVKSVSGFIGIGKTVKSHPYTCRMCKQENCVYRRARETKMINT